jgi:hypothetical protein
MSWPVWWLDWWDWLLHPTDHDLLDTMVAVLILGFWALAAIVSRVGSAIEERLDRVIELLEERQPPPRFDDEP